MHRSAIGDDARGESPKGFFRHLARLRQRQQLSEDRPEEIVALCEAILLGSREQAAQRVAPLVRLNYERLDPRISEMIENTLYYAMTGDRRAAVER